MIEKEVKLEISGQKDFEQALAYFTKYADNVFRDRLVNYYLDTAGLDLANKLVMIRVRTAKNNVLTYKNGTQVEEGYFRSTEIETELDDAQVQQALSDPSWLFEQNLAPMREVEEEFGTLHLEVIGSLENERCKLEVEGHRVELDRMRFPDGSEAYECELESEDPESARSWCLEQLAKADVVVKPSTKTKFHRLLIKMGKVTE